MPNILLLRLVVAIASICLVVWGGAVLNVSVDALVWNALFAIINLGHAGYLLYQMRPIKLDPDLDTAYRMVRLAPHTLSHPYPEFCHA